MTELRDPVSSASHLLTALWAVFATLVMCRLAAQRPGRLVPVVVYGLSMVLLYTASGTFHGLPYPASTPEGRFFQKLDQSAVYLLIAGSVTPAIAILLEGAWRRRFLMVMWGLALSGVANAYNAASGTLDTRADINELTNPPLVEVCKLVRQLTPNSIPQTLADVCDQLAPVIDGLVPLPTPAQALSDLQNGTLPALPLPIATTLYGTPTAGSSTGGGQ